jgi:penicillin-binding protein 2
MAEVEFAFRKQTFLIAISVIFFLLTARLVQLQIVYRDAYGKKSEENSIRPITHDAIRGYMFDRNGKLVVDNRPSYTITITPAEFDPGTVDELANILQLDRQFILDRVKKGREYNRFTPTKIKRDVDFATLSYLEENRGRLPGLDFEIESKRYYPTKANAPHLFGYTKEISERQLAELGEPYRQGDIIGSSGLEAAYEQYLRGEKGIEFITVNAKGQLLGAYNDGRNDIPSREGHDLFLTLDSDLQAFAESLLTDKHGAIVALDPRNGGVLAFASKPEFDPMLFSGVTPPKVWSDLNNDPGKPLFNRVTLTRYPPGSTFKMVLAAAALQEGIISTSFRVQCTGAYQFGNRIYKDLHVHGSTDVYEAIQKSCNVFFYTVMMKTGLDVWERYAREFGFGSITGVDITEENPGLIPSEEYYNRVYGKGRWTQGYLVSLGIGQGEVGVSPIQMAAYAMVLANKGTYYQPHAVAGIRNKMTHQRSELSLGARSLAVTTNVWNVIREGMYRCVNTPGGTGGASRVPDVIVGGKTGTAENPHGQDHAWFIGFAPYDDPIIAICVMVENAGFGGAIAAPMAGLCIEKYIYGEIIRYKRRPPVVVVQEKPAEQEQETPPEQVEPDEE